ncbi:flagellar basal body P-ring formation chaperone FlgA [Desulfovibrio oxyclinae]|uniref:flagellar basal body P-ring formation chaperone FlgA n=1 Tax=Desulfovibrio oxyclinae TaxID=63560 RepID=UPI00037307E3|nr:flagellar basal body P-ring formation chaperone FlgA [Desulfovibrio oxyclinae]
MIYGNTARDARRPWGLGVAVVAAMCLAALVMASTVHAGEWRIRIKPAAVLDGGPVTLGDIAVAVGDVDAPVWKRLSGTKLWKPSSRRGRPVAISRDKLRSILRHYIGEYERRCEVPSRMLVQTGGKVILVNEIRRRVVEYLTPRAERFDAEISFRDFAVPDYIFFPNRFDKLKVDSSRDVRPGRNSVQMEVVTSDGKTVRRLAGSVFMDVWKAVPAAAQIMNRGERITPDKLTFVRKNLAYATNTWDGKGGPWRIRRPVGRGQAITRDRIEALPAVSRGEHVNLVYDSGRVKLSVEVEVLDDAKVGQQVEVRNMQSNRTIVATVVSPGKVMVR